MTVIIAMNLVTFILFAWDKFISGRKGRRVPESNLLVLSLLFGAFGAFMSMYLFRHKTQKLKFTISVPIMMVLQIAFIIMCL